LILTKILKLMKSSKMTLYSKLMTKNLHLNLLVVDPNMKTAPIMRMIQMLIVNSLTKVSSSSMKWKIMVNLVWKIRTSKNTD